MRMSSWELAWFQPRRFTPFGFPLMVERIREKVSTEKATERVQRLLAELEKAAQASEPVSEEA
jgi:ATP-dependent Lhr-like helicase